MQSPTLTNTAQLELDTLLANAVASRELPNVVAMVANRDEILYQGAFGAAITGIYRLASLTKPVTSLAIMMLRERRLLDLDEPLERYLPEYSGRAIMEAFNVEDCSYTTTAATHPITLRHLLTHTAGFGYDFTSVAVQKLCEGGKATPRMLPLLFDPGSRWHYGCATGILADLITEVTGAPFYTFFDTEIFKPLGMNETSYVLDANGLTRLVPLAFRKDNEWIKDANPRPHQPFVAGDGGLLSPVGDYLRFAQMLLNEGALGSTRLLNAESVREMARNQIGELHVETLIPPNPRTSLPFPAEGKADKFGLGFQIRTESVANRRSTGSFWWMGIFNTHFWVDPQMGITALFFTQLLPFFDAQTMRLLDEFEHCIYRNLASNT